MFGNFEFGFNLVSGIVLTCFVAAFASIMAVALPFVRSDAFAARRRAVAAKREELAVAQREGFQQRRRLKTGRSESWMRVVIQKLNLTEMLEAKDLKRRLVQAGWRKNSAPVTFIFMRIAAPLILAGIAAFYAWTVFADWSLTKKALMVLCTFLFGGVLPSIILTNAVQKRQKVLTRAFPDALDLMVICVESGMTIEAAFNKVSEEMAESAPIMAEEIGLTAAELSFLSDRRSAYENLHERTGLATVKSLTTTLLQSEKYGTPIASGLRVIAQENRDQRLSAAEKKAAALPAQLTVPMIIFFLPVLFIVIAGPAGIQVAAMMKH